MKLPFRRRFRRAWKAFRGEFQSPFRGADTNRLTADWIANNKSADEEIKSNIRKLRARARDLVRNNGYIEQYIGDLTVNVIGPTGFTLFAQVRLPDGSLDKDTNDAIEAAFKDWAEAPVTTDGMLNLVDLEDVLVETMAKDGETFVRMHEGFKDNRHRFALEPIDADLLDENYNVPRGRWQNEIRMGIEFDGRGRRLGYWFSKNIAETYAGIGGERYFVPASEILHLYMHRRVNQTRGISWLTPIMYPVVVLDGYEETELYASRAGSGQMGFFETTDLDLVEDSKNEKESKKPITIDAAPASLRQLPPGWTFKPWTPEHPVAAFPAFVKMILRKISSGVRAFYNVLANDQEGVNYSSMRSGLVLLRDRFRKLHQFWIFGFRSPIYKRWLRMALLSRTLVLDSYDAEEYSAASWQGRGWDWVDPESESASVINEIANGLNSPQNVCAARGYDFEKICEQLKEAKRIAKDNELEFPWAVVAASKTTRAQRDGETK